VSVNQSTGHCLYFFSAEFNFTLTVFDLILLLMHITETKKLLTVITKYIVY